MKSAHKIAASNLQVIKAANARGLTVAAFLAQCAPTITVWEVR